MERVKMKRVFCSLKLGYIIVLIASLVIAGIAIKSIVNAIENKSSECVLQQTTCCECEMGGNRQCMTKNEALAVQENLSRDCSKDILCAAVYNCVETTCIMINGKCQSTK